MLFSFLQKLSCFSVDTPGHGSGWAETPRTDRGGDSIGETPTPGASKRKSRWDETPASQMGGSTPVLTPGKTPIGTPAMNMATPTPGRPSPFSKASLSSVEMEAFTFILHFEIDFCLTRSPACVKTVSICSVYHF